MTFYEIKGRFYLTGSSVFGQFRLKNVEVKQT